MADARLLPPSINDPRSQAITALAGGATPLNLGPLAVYLIDTVPADALDLLLEQFAVQDFVLAGASDTDKRELLKRAIELHRFKGTPWAVQNVLLSYSLTGTVIEWFVEDAAPYTFRVRLRVADNMGTATEALIEGARIARTDRLVASVKSARDAFTIDIDHEPEAQIGAAVQITGQGHFAATATAVAAVAEAAPYYVRAAARAEKRIVL